jgi:ubiquinone/menaquinone biosynthesis C-methylase UbiE
MSINATTFNSESHKYFQYRPRYPKALYEFIASVCPYKEVVWDSACGNGQVAVDISEYFSIVEASDIHENQIKNSFEKDNVHYSLQNSESTNYPDNFFDAVCVAQALHWFNLETFFYEVKRVLKKEGVFFCWGYSFFRINLEIDQIINDFLLKEIEPFWSENNKSLHHEYVDINFPFEKIETPKFEMKETWELGQLIEYLSTWSAVKLYNKNRGFNILDDLIIKLSEYWKETELKEIKIDFFCYGFKN